MRVLTNERAEDKGVLELLESPQLGVFELTLELLRVQGVLRGLQLRQRLVDVVDSLGVDLLVLERELLRDEELGSAANYPPGRPSRTQGASAPAKSCWK